MTERIGDRSLGRGATTPSERETDARTDLGTRTEVDGGTVRRDGGVGVALTGGDRAALDVVRPEHVPVASGLSTPATSAPGVGNQSSPSPRVASLAAISVS